MDVNLDYDPYAANATFNPYVQELLLVMPDGLTPSTINLSMVDVLVQSTARAAMIFGVQIGITAIMLLVVLLMTKPEKRCNAVFILNVLALALVFVRSIVQCVIFFGPNYNFYNWAIFYTPDGPEEQQNVRNLVAAEALGFLVIVAIELSMLLQTFTVINMLRNRFQTITNITCVFVASIAIGLRFATMVVNCKWSILDRDGVSLAKMSILKKLLAAQNACIIASIIIFSTIFCFKLWQAIRKRKSIGLKRFGPLQIIFVMGCQTLVIPALFGIMSYWVLPDSPLNTMMMCVVVAFLPLSSIWASTKADGRHNIAAPAQWHGKQTAPNSRYDSEKGLLPSTVNTTLVGDSPRGPSFSGAGSKQLGHHATVSRSSIDSELAKMGQDSGIKVKNTYSIRSD